MKRFKTVQQTFRDTNTSYVAKRLNTNVVIHHGELLNLEQLLHFSDDFSGSKTYRFVGVVNHEPGKIHGKISDSIEAGHYTSDVINHNLLMHMDDSKTATFIDKVNGRNAYLLYYRRETEDAMNLSELPPGLETTNSVMCSNRGNPSK